MTSIKDIVFSLGSSINDLSQSTDITADRLDDILSGSLDPSLRELSLIAASLNLEIGDLFESNDHQKISLFFRNAEYSDDHFEITINRIRRKLEDTINVLNPREIPSWLLAFGVLDYNYDEAERLSLLFRNHFLKSDDLIRPLTDLPSILSRKADLLVFINKKMKFDGAAGIFRGWPFIFIGARFQPRMLFTLCHELGHLVSRQGAEEFAIFDHEESVGSYFGNSKFIEESFADAFASSLLVPTAGVGRALQNIRSHLGAKGDSIGDIEVIYLARFFGVSFDVAAIRCEQLGLLPSGGARSMKAFLDKEYGSPEKRASKIGAPDRPKINFSVTNPLLTNKCLEAIRDGEISLGSAADLLDLSANEILKLNADTLH